MSKLPSSHPRHLSLTQRHRLETGVKKGMTHKQGLIAHGRGEAFDYLLGERTHAFSRRACEAAAALLLIAKKPAISVNGNVAALCPKEIVALGKATGSKIEVNLFYRTRAREKAIAKELAKYGAQVLGVSPDSRIKGLASERGKVSSCGIGSADVVLVPLEDGDRAGALKKAGKKVIAIDLNPLSRTARTGTITIVDNVTRALPLMASFAKKLRKRTPSELARIVKSFDNKSALREAEREIRKGL